jgi:hypothetical protein
MGYRSTFVTDDCNIKLPKWFLDKWGSMIHTYDGQMPISSKMECKTYGRLIGFELDLQKVVSESESRLPIHIVFMGEDGALSKSTIFAERIEGEHITSPDNA